MSSPRPRESSPTNPAEWSETEDGFPFKVGDRLFNYYDGKWGVVAEESRADAGGWFYFDHEDGTRVMLNCVRVAKNEPTR